MQGMARTVIHHRHGHLEHLRPETTSQLPPEQERHHRQADNAVAKTPGHTVRQALDRGAPRLSLLHQGNNPGQSGVAAHPLHLQLQGALEIQASGTELGARLSIQGERFPREAGQINR